MKRKSFKCKTRYYRLKDKHLKEQKEKMSPKSNVKRELNGKNVPLELKKKLLSAVALKTTRNKFQSKSHKQKREFMRCVTGNTTKKYRCFNDMRNIGSYKLFSLKGLKSTKRVDIAKEIRHVIQKFYQKGENSSVAPGKKDSITFHQIKKQKRFLNDTMKNLYYKFSREEKRFNVSYALFCQHMPFWVLIPKASLRETCLCVFHENMRLLVLKMKMIGIVTQANPDDVKNVCCEPATKHCLERVCQNCKTKTIRYDDYNAEENTCYKKWILKREKLLVKGLEKVCQKNVKENFLCTKSHLVIELEKNLPNYMEHLAKIEHQHKAIDYIKWISQKITPVNILKKYKVPILGARNLRFPFTLWCGILNLRMESYFSIAFAVSPKV
ncbi:unnamed protein product [Psylliodes chrysocephalus]|uniref:Uncharacterized protein n=1 Tax=Psylliodes chrysocephalus TaxID=3402493 RepID=A0A9P0D0X5_9CUCU|nr:unnamed protein product [Psylliodes chrysocephala]